MNNITLTTEEKEKLRKNFGEQFRKLYRKKYPSDKKFLLETNFNKRMLFRLKNGENPTLSTLYLISKVLDLPLHDLLKFDPQKSVRLKAYERMRKQ
jgi:hypothetical protein